MPTEKVKESRDAAKEDASIAKIALSLLEKETRINFFKNASNGLKGLFGLRDSSSEEDSGNSAANPAGVDSSKSSKGSNPKEFESSYTNEHISEAKVKQARNYISGGGTFNSGSKGTVTWGRGKYKHVCSTGSFNVLWRLGFPKVSNSTECDLNGTILPKMGLEYIGEVNPDNPGENGYKPQDGDTAVWPRFHNGKKMTQHQATFINGHWVSDTIQSKMSCYSSKNEPMVKVYRYKGKKN